MTSKIHTPFVEFDRNAWQRFREDTPMPLSKSDLANLRGQIEAVSSVEVEQVYLPLSRLLNLYIAATQQLYNVTAQFLGHPEPKVTYVIGIAGSVAVGKSTTSRVLQALLSRWPNHPRVEIVTTDGFLFPTKVLEERNLMNRKGFPESYDVRALIQFLVDLKSGKRNLKVPVYSHTQYDIVPNDYQIVDQPDIVIIEGINVLQVGPSHLRAKKNVFVSDYFDFGLYVEADTEVIKQWFMQRFKLFRQRAKNDTDDYYHQFTDMSNQQADDYADEIWETINAKNLAENILPFKERAHLILHKSADHSVERVYLRKL